MSDRGERLIAALRDAPDLLFEVLRDLRHDRVAGPWKNHPDDHTKKHRVSPSGKKVAVVSKHATRSVHPWEASTIKPEDAETRPSKNHPTQGQAMDWADMQLLEQGYALAGGS